MQEREIGIDWDSLTIRAGQNLPHWSCQRAVYHVVLRLDGSLPATVLARWRLERDTILDNARVHGGALSEDMESRLKHLFSGLEFIHGDASEPDAGAVRAVLAARAIRPRDP